ncbi:hypothetical protein GCM10023153_18620 [Ornithinibacter aureus]|uniref:Uncharacterized protein n=1 Tax=Ornithinibacter aureus TaxID=622664 RepID=A0ABP8JTS2_9MICO|nr:hypothetical protein [Ornithinibacter aureus]
MMRRALVVALALVAATLGLALAPPANATASDTAPIVIVGAPGLAWSDLERDDLPALTAMVEQGASGSITARAVRSRSCAIDGWLTLSAGRRAGDLPGPCREPLPPVDGLVPNWADYVAAAAADSYDARPGLLAEEVTASGACVQSIGPGAAIGGADPDGAVGPTSSDTLPTSVACPVVLVDGGALPTTGPERADAVARLDALVAQVVGAAPGADVVVAGLGDGDSSVRPRAVVASGPSFEAGLLTSGSTRQPGLIQLQDLTATALTRIGVEGAPISGRAVSVEPGASSASERVDGLVGFETRAATLRSVSPQVTGWLAVGFALWAALGALWWWRRGASHELPRALVTAGVAVAAVPISTFAANLVPWWQMPAPAVAFVAILGAVTALVVAVALGVERRHPLGALRTVALFTVVVLAGDVILGSRLQLGSVFGQNPTVGGRFYGFGNTSFALYGLAALVLVAWVAGARWRSRQVAVGLGFGLLVVLLAIEGLPSLGADFGGPPGLLLGGLVVIAGAAGVRLTVRRSVVAVAAAGLLVAAMSWLDWRRPPASRTHLGEFVDTVISGEAGSVLGRKLAQNLTNLGSPPLLAISIATVVLVVVAWRTGWRPVDAGVPVLRGALVLAVVGFAVNDSGLVIPAFVALVLAPLLVAAGRALAGVAR